MIIIFGAAVRPNGGPSGAMRGRVNAALDWARQLEAAGAGEAAFMPTGGQGRYGRPEAEVMADLLERDGITAARIQLEPTGTNTFRSVLACARLLRGHEGPVYVASSAYHLPRCIMLLSLARVAAKRCPPPRIHASASARRRWYWRLRELAAVPVDCALMLCRRGGGRL